MPAKESQVDENTPGKRPEWRIDFAASQLTQPRNPFLRRHRAILTLLAAVLLGATLVVGAIRAAKPSHNNQDSLETMVPIAWEALAEGRYSDALKQFETALEKDVDNVRVLKGLGAVYEAQQDWHQAAKWYEKWTQVVPEEPTALVALGHTLFQSQEYERAVAAYKQAETVGADVDHDLGLGFYILAQYEKATERLLDTANQYTDDFLTQRALGLSLFAQERLEEAAEYLKRAKELGTGRTGEELADLYYALGRYYLGAKDFEQAAANFELAWKSDPKGLSKWASAARTDLQLSYIANVMDDALLDLDFSNITAEGDETYVMTELGQKVTIGGAVHLVSGPYQDSRALVVEEETTNLIKNPIFEFNVRDGWRGPARLSSHRKFVGSASAKLIASDDSNANHRSNPFTLADGESVTFQTRVWRGQDTPAGIVIRDVTNNSTPVSVPATKVRTWEHLVATWTNDTGSDVEIRCYVGNRGEDGTAALWFDAAQAETNAYPTTFTYGDAGRGYDWIGEPHASSSTRQATVVDADNLVGLISRREQFTIRVLAQIPYDAGARWPASDGNNMLFDLKGVDDGQRVILYYTSGDDAFGLSVNGSLVLMSPKQPFAAGDWIDLVVTLDFTSDSFELFIDGTRIGSSNHGTSAPDLTLFRLGTDYAGQNQGGFAFARLGIFDRVLVADEIEALYKTGTFVER